jgi:hypothetical protein
MLSCERVLAMTLPSPPSLRYPRAVSPRRRPRRRAQHPGHWCLSPPVDPQLNMSKGLEQNRLLTHDAKLIIAFTTFFTERYYQVLGRASEHQDDLCTEASHDQDPLRNKNSEDKETEKRSAFLYSTTRGHRGNTYIPIAQISSKNRQAPLSHFISAPHATLQDMRTPS